MRTAPEFEESHTLADGLVVRLRHIRPEDDIELRRQFQRLSPTSRFRRFFGSLDTLDDATVHYLTHVDGTNHVAIVALTDSPDLKTDIGLGVARFIRLANEHDVAEAAVVVVDDYQGQGIGTLLGLVLAEAARERGITRFRAEVLASNDQARQLMHDVNAHLVRADEQCVLFDIPVTNGDSGPPTRIAAVRALLREAARQVFGLVRSLRTSSHG